jgi:HEAT repeat protein
MKASKNRRRRIPAFFAQSRTHLRKLARGDALLIGSLSHPLVYHRTVALRAIEASGRADLAPYLFPLLLDRHSFLQSDAAVALGKLLAGSNNVPRPLKRLLRDSYWVTRIDALESVDAIGDYRVLPLLARALGDSHPIVRSYAGSILGATQWRHFVPRLRRALARERSDRAKVGMLHGLFLLGDTHLFDPLLELLQSSDYTMRCAVIHSLEDMELSQVQRTRTIAALEQLEGHEPTRAVLSTVTPFLEKLTMSED